MSEPDALSTLAAELSRTRSEARLARRSYRFTMAVIVIAIGTGGWLFWNDHEQEVARQQADRQYELDQCERGNVTRQAIAEGRVQDSEALIAAFTQDRDVSARTQQIVDAYRARVAENIKAFEPRDCAALLKAGSK